MRFGIRYKLIVFTFCIVLLVGGSISLHSIYQGRQQILSDFERDAREITTLISTNIVDDLYFLNVHALRLRLESSRANPDIGYTYVTDPDGVVLTDGTRDNPLRDQKLTDDFSKTTLHSSGWISRLEAKLLKVGGPIFAPDGSHLGYLQVGFSLESVEQTVRESTRTSFYITLICLAVGILLAFVLATGLTRPIFAIIEASTEIGAGKLDTRLPSGRKDELGALARSINQMAEGLQRRQAETERKSHELGALNAITTATSQSLELKDLFEIALDKTVEVTGRERVNLRLKDSLTGKVSIVAHRGFSEEEIDELRRRTLHPMSAQVFASGNPFIVNTAQDNRSLALLAATRSVAWIPIKTGARVVAVLGISDDQSKPFSPSEVRLLEAIGSVIGVAIENARLFGETKRNLEGIRALHEIDMAITSTLDLHDILAVLLEKIDLFLPYSTATVRLFNKESGLLEPVACRNLDEEEWKLVAWKPGRGPANAVFESKAPLMIGNCLNDPRVKDPEFFRKHGLVSYLGVPLIAKEEILGVLSFYTKEEHEFTAEEVEFLSTLAGQAAVAIHNARLYEETRIRETQLQETNRMLSALHSVAAAASQSLDLSQVLEAAISKITEIFRFDATQIHIYNERADELFLGANFEREPNRFASVQSFRRGQGIVGKVAESGKPLIFEDVQTDPLYRQFSRTKVTTQFGYHFFAVFPIRGKLKNLGTLACTGIDPRKLSSGEIQLLEAVADQIAVAIENSGLYEEMVKLAADLSRSNKVKDEFLSVMSHELRTPLNVVMGYTGMIRDGLLGEINPEQERALEKVISRARDQLVMISSILQATQMEAEGIKVERREVSLKDFLDDLKSNYSIPLGKEISLVWDYPSDLPAISTDGEKLKYVLQNLINNAIKFTDKGSVTISAHASPLAPQASERWVELKVSDTGVGIADENLSIIFERFRQVDSSETRKYGGVGIGLYIAKQFTQLLGGRIEAESEPGKGSIFTVTMPCGMSLPQLVSGDQVESYSKAEGREI